MAEIDARYRPERSLFRRIVEGTNLDGRRRMARSIRDNLQDIEDDPDVVLKDYLSVSAAYHRAIADQAFMFLNNCDSPEEFYEVSKLLSRTLYRAVEAMRQLGADEGDRGKIQVVYEDE